MELFIRPPLDDLEDFSLLSSPRSRFVNFELYGLGCDALLVRFFDLNLSVLGR